MSLEIVVIGRLILIVNLVAALLLAPDWTLAQTVTATLSVLAGEVQITRAGSDTARLASDGDDLAAGDRVLTAPGATALITFLDGNTLTVQPEADILIKSASVDANGGSAISIQINAGAVWARVAGLSDPNAGFTLESTTASATVRDGKQGGQQNPDGSFQCWVLGGEMLVTDKQSGATTLLRDGQTTLVQGSEIGDPRQFLVNQSSLRVTAPEAILPLLVVPGTPRLAGFAGPGIEVNQVFGAATVRAEVGRMVEVPAGQDGLYRLVLEAGADGPFQIFVTGLFEGRDVQQQALTGSLKKGERLATDVTVQLDPATVGYARTARLIGLSATPLQPFSGPLPGKLPLAPGQAERAAAG